MTSLQMSCGSASPPIKTPGYAYGPVIFHHNVGEQEKAKELQFEILLMR